MKFSFISKNFDIPSLKECVLRSLQGTFYFDPACAKCQQAPCEEYCCGPSLMLMAFKATLSSAAEKEVS